MNSINTYIRDSMRAVLHGYKSTFKFKGREARYSFWSFFLVATFGVDALIGYIFPMDGVYTDHLTLWQVIHMLCVLINMIARIAASTRRLHDTNRAGWWSLLLLYVLWDGLALDVLFFLFIIVVMTLFWTQEGDSGRNQYGEKSGR